MSDRFPGGVISKTPPEVVGPTDGEGGSASGVWTLDEVLGYEKAGGWPKPVLPKELYAWGGNSPFGQLGDGTVVDKSSPVQIGALINWADVSAGVSFSAAIKTDGTLWTWGQNDFGQLGHGNTINRSSPVQVGALTNWAQVSTGSSHCGAVKTDGSLWTWGRGQIGKLGHGNTVYLSSPVQVGALTNWAQISVGLDTTAAVKTDGTLWAWGRNGDGQLGINLSYASSPGRSSPVQVGALTNWYVVSLGQTHAAATKTDGTVWTWGRNTYGNLGLNDDRAPRSSPVQVGALTNWSKVTCGTYGQSVISIKTDKSIWGWGNNFSGQLGDGTIILRSSPVQIGNLTNWLEINAGDNHTVAVKDDGTLWAWGYNGAGQVGDGTTSGRSSPVQIGALSSWSKVAGGSFHTLATTKG